MEWDPSSRSTSTGYGRRFIDNECEYATSTPYYQMGEPRKGGWFGIWKRILRRPSKKKKAIDQHNAVTHAAAPSNDPRTCMQNFDWGSARGEPENLPRSFSVQFGNPSGFRQRMR